MRKEKQNNDWKKTEKSTKYYTKTETYTIKNRKKQDLKIPQIGKAEKEKCTNLKTDYQNKYYYYLYRNNKRI